MSLLLRCIVAIFFLSVWVLPAQTYVGEVLYDGGYQYVKISVTDSVTRFSMPYLDKDKSFEIAGKVNRNSDWSLVRDLELWRFTTFFSGNTVQGELYLGGKIQNVQFLEQQEALSESELTKYEGVFQDEMENRALVYARNGYLHLISPFSKRTMSLKPIDKDKFWSVSGETSLFSDLMDELFTQLLLYDRFNTSVKLKKLPPISIEEVYIPIEQDTLYAKLFLPSTSTKAPACLVLPGGGAVGMDNYEYEARYFAAQGMVAMLFDKSGNGKSKGTGNFRLQTFEEKTDQYLKLFEFLQNHPNVEKTKVGIHGPSEGGRLALMMAIDNPEVAFVNATAAPIMDMRNGQLYAVQHYLRNRGIVETDIVAITTIWKNYYQEIIEGKINPQTIQLANSYREKYDRLFLPPDATEVPGSPNASDLLNDRVAKEAGKINCPIFLQYGENDERVQAKKSIENFQRYIKKDVPLKIKLYPRANHSFMTPEFEISHGYLHDKKLWLENIGIL